jgi:hypothetical protein
MPQAETVKKTATVGNTTSLITDRPTENPLIHFSLSKSPTKIASCQYNSAKHNRML